MSNGENEVAEALNQSNRGSNALNNSRPESVSQERRHPFASRFKSPFFKCCITMCNTSWSINYTPLCMTFVFFSMAIVTLAVSGIMSVYNDYREAGFFIDVNVIKKIKNQENYSLVLDLNPLGDKKNTEFIILYGMSGFRQVKLYPSLLDYSVVTRVTSDESIFNKSLPVGIHSMFNDTFTCKFLDSKNQTIDTSTCSCDENSIIFPFGDKLIPAQFSFKSRLINWLDLSPYDIFFKPLCKMTLPDKNIVRINITGTKNWEFWADPLTKGLNTFHFKAVVPSLFGGNTEFLEIMGFVLGGFCTFVGIIVLGAYFHQKRARDQ